MKIQTIKTEPYERQLHQPFKMYNYTQTHLRDLIVRIESDDGYCGYGEVISFNSTRRDVERDHLMVDRLIGLHVAELPALLRAMHRETPPYSFYDGSDPFVWQWIFALETAYHDLLARRAGVPLSTLLGGRMVFDAPDFMTIAGDEDVTALTAHLGQDAPDRRVIQMKCGGMSESLDEERIDAALSKMGKDQIFLADFNGALSVGEARAMIARFSDKRLIWEEPCESFEDNRTLAELTGAPILMDQCGTLANMSKACATGCFVGYTIKPVFMGSLTNARAARDMAIASGLKVRIDGAWCGGVAVAAILQLAVGTPEHLLLAANDLREFLILPPDEDIVLEKRGGISKQGKSARIAPLPGPGLGFVPQMSR
nr:mandelate racemase/muconate lactonizing enzyme family protein [Mesorhizobium sp. WSM4875]